MKILSVILSCQKERKLWPNWRKEHAVIICGNPQLKESFELKNNILFVKSPDRYDFLPFKMICAYNAVLQIKELSSYTHVLKYDGHDTKISPQQIEGLEKKLDKEDNYCGWRIFRKTWKNNRQHHFANTPKESFWHEKPYKGPIEDWFNGGDSYILSRKSLRVISEKYNFNCQQEVTKSHVFEDTMIGLILHEKGILPKQIDYKIIKT